MAQFSSTEKQLPPINYPRLCFKLAIPALAISFALLFAALLQSIAVSIISEHCPWIMDQDWYLWVMSLVPLYAVAMPLALHIYRLDPPEPIPVQRKLSVKTLLGILSVCFALTLLGNGLGKLINDLIGAITGTQPANQLQERTIASPFWTNLLFCGLLAPVVEEIFYRKMVIDRLRFFGELPAILISGTVFGLIHGNFNQLFYSTFIGILFGYIYVYTGRLRYTIGLHMTFNLIGGVYSTEVLKRIDLDRFKIDPIAEITENLAGGLMMIGYLLFLLAALTGALITVFLFLKNPPRLQKSPRPLRPAEWAQVLLLNPGTWVFAVVVLMLFL